MKDLSALRHSEGDQKKLFEYVFNKGEIAGSEYDEMGRLTLSGTFYWDISRIASCKIHIWDDGSVFLEESGQEVLVENIFALVDFIRDLGYEPTK